MASCSNMNEMEWKKLLYFLVCSTQFQSLVVVLLDLVLIVISTASEPPPLAGEVGQAALVL